MMSENRREIVNGKLLSQFKGKRVSITGFVMTVNPNGQSLEMRTVDDMLVKVQLKRPTEEPIEGYVEFHGISQGNVIACDEMIIFKKEEGEEDFDVAGHNSCCVLLNSIPALWDLQ